MVAGAGASIIRRPANPSFTLAAVLLVTGESEQYRNKNIEQRKGRKQFVSGVGWWLLEAGGRQQGGDTCSEIWVGIKQGRQGQQLTAARQ